MPVTAKLSKRFYDKLGDEVANELVEWFNSVDATYRSDLRELNELNFARFDAKLEQRIAQLGAELRTEFRAALSDEVGALRRELGTRIASVETQIGSLRRDMERQFGSQRTDSDNQIGSLRQEMRDSIANLRAELIKWSFVFFATAALAVIGLR